jgi:hypothetical protein
MTIKELLIQERENWKTLATMLSPDTRPLSHPWLIQEFLLRNGRGFIGRALPQEYELGEIKRCYENARELALYEGLRYYEGVVCWNTQHDLHGLLLPHAWCVDEDDGVVDPTLQDTKSGLSSSAKHDYWGLEFGPDDLEHDWTGSMLLNEIECYRLDVMYARDPEFQQIVENNA